MTDVAKSKARQLVMQPLNCVIYLLGLTILSATFGTFATIVHKELIAVSNGERNPENTLKHGIEETRRKEEIRSNIFAGRKMAFGVEVLEKDYAKNDRREINNYSTNSRVSSSLKGSSSSRMKAGMANIKLEGSGSTSEQALNIPNPEHIRILPFKPSYRSLSLGSKKEQKDSVVCSTLYRTNEDLKEKMLESSDEVLRLLNKDYHATPHKRRPVHN